MICHLDLFLPHLLSSLLVLLTFLGFLVIQVQLLFSTFSFFYFPPILCFCVVSSLFCHFEFGILAHLYFRVISLILIPGSVICNHVFPDFVGFLPACVSVYKFSYFLLYFVWCFVFVFSFTPLLLFSQLVKLPSQVSPVCPHHLVYLFLQLYSVFVVFFLITFVCVSFLYSFWIPHSWGTFSLEFSIKAAF